MIYISNPISMTSKDRELFFILTLVELVLKARETGVENWMLNQAQRLIQLMDMIVSSPLALTGMKSTQTMELVHYFSPVY